MIESLVKRLGKRLGAEIRGAAAAARLFTGPGSALRFRRLLLARRGFKKHVDARPSVVRLRPLGGAPVLLRPQSADIQTVIDVFLDREHVPPKQVSHPSVILDLGANIGLTMAHFATLFPAARILGAELDPDNAALCVENTERWRDRCEVVAAGVWVRDGTVPYVRREGREVSHAIAEAATDATSWTTAISIDSLLQRLPATTEVDYMKMDIEGAEREVLRSAQSWARVCQRSRWKSTLRTPLRTARPTCRLSDSRRRSNDDAAPT